MKLKITAKDVAKALANRDKPGAYNYRPSCQCVVTVAAQRQFKNPKLRSNYRTINLPDLEEFQALIIPSKLSELMRNFDGGEFDGKTMIGSWELVAEGKA